MKLIDRNKKEIKFKNIEVINSKISELEKYIDLNPTKNYKEKIDSLLASEIFSSLFTEGEISSRSLIKKMISSKKEMTETEIGRNIKNFLAAYNYIQKKPKFSISTFFTLYSMIATGTIEERNELEDGHFFRHEDVFIENNKYLDTPFKGFEVKDLSKAITMLSEYLNNSEDNIYLKSVLGHIYFEMIHPYFDFNGRTGRFIPVWLFARYGEIGKMFFFSTAIGNYRKQYLSLFKQNIDTRTFVVNWDKIVVGILNLLILNQKQYIWYKEKEKEHLNKTNKSFSNVQMNFIWMLMIKAENTNATDSWFKFSTDDRDFVETNIKSSLLSNATRGLMKTGIIKISNDLHKKYKLLDYKLLK